MPRVANALPTRRTAGLGGVKHIHLDIRLRGLVLLSLNTVPQYHYGSKSRTNGKRFLSRISRAHRWALGSGTAGARPKGCICRSDQEDFRRVSRSTRDLLVGGLRSKAATRPMPHARSLCYRRATSRREAMADLA